MDYGACYDQILSAKDICGSHGQFWAALKCLEIELIETINMKFRKNSRKYYNYMLFDSQSFFRVFYMMKGSRNGITDDEMHAFLSGCFYLGKGQADRPNMHLQEAYDGCIFNEKLETINEIWNRGGGVLIFKFFHNASSFVASTREAILIDLIGLHNLTNVRRGSYYGGVEIWGKKVLINLGKYYMLRMMTECCEQHFEIVLKEDMGGRGGGDMTKM